MAENAARGEKGAFAEADARLAGMHGYEPVDLLGIGQGALNLAELAQLVQAGVIDLDEPVPLRAVYRLEAKIDGLEAKLDRLETLVRDLIHAMKAGAVGKWG